MLKTEKWTLKQLTDVNDQFYIEFMNDRAAHERVVQLQTHRYRIIMYEMDKLVTRSICFKNGVGRPNRMLIFLHMLASMDVDLPRVLDDTVVKAAKRYQMINVVESSAWVSNRYANLNKIQHNTTPEKVMKFETIQTVDGQDVKSMSKADLIYAIECAEKKRGTLEQIQTESTAIKGEIDTINDYIASVVKVLDAK